MLNDLEVEDFNTTTSEIHFSLEGDDPEFLYDVQILKLECSFSIASSIILLSYFCVSCFGPKVMETSHWMQRASGICLVAFGLESNRIVIMFL
jgi:hypothetical protein